MKMYARAWRFWRIGWNPARWISDQQSWCSGFIRSCPDPRFQNDCGRGQGNWTQPLEPLCLAEVAKIKVLGSCTMPACLLRCVHMSTSIVIPVYSSLYLIVVIRNDFQCHLCVCVLSSCVLISMAEKLACTSTWGQPRCWVRSPRVLDLVDRGRKCSRKTTFLFRGQGLALGFGTLHCK